MIILYKRKKYKMKFNKNTGKSESYKKIIDLIFDRKFSDLDNHIKVNYPDNCYTSLNNLFYGSSLEKSSPFKYYTLSTDYFFDFLDDVCIPDEEVQVKHAEVVPEEILKITNLNELSKIFTGFEDLECVLKYIFLKDGRYGISIGYSEVHAETINEIFKSFDPLYMREFFKELDKHYINSFHHISDTDSIIISFKNEKFKVVFHEFMKLLSPKKLASLYFEFIPKNPPIVFKDHENVTDIRQLFFHYYSIYKFKNEIIGKINRYIVKYQDFNRIFKLVKKFSPHIYCYDRSEKNIRFYIPENISYNSLNYPVIEALNYINQHGYPENKKVHRLVLSKKMKEKIRLLYDQN